MEILSRTLKSLTRREKLVSVFFLAIFLASFYSLTFGRNNTGGIAKGKTYSEGVVGEITHLSPLFTEFSDADADISPLIFSGLMKYNAATGDFEEDIATYTLSEDLLTYTFTLRNELYWHDGEALDSEDLYFTFHDVIQSDEFTNPILKSNFEGVTVEAPNSRTISFTLNSPNSFFLTALNVGIVPQHILGEVPVSELDTHEYNRQPVGNGPYLVASPYEKSADGSTSVTLQRFDGYHGELPSIESLRFIAYPSSNELVENRNVWHSAARIQQNLLNQMNIEGLVTHSYELPQYTALFINTDSLMMDERAERQALSYAINKEEILETIGYKVQIDSPILDLDEAQGTHEYDPEKAAEALVEADWVDTPLEIRLVRRDFSADNPVQEEVQLATVNTLREQLDAVGIVLNVEAYAIEELQEVIRARDYDVLLYGQSLGYNLDIFGYWHSSQVGEGGLNLSNYQNPKADFFMESARTATNEAERDELLLSLAEMIDEDIPAVFLYTPSYYYLTDVDLTGVNIKRLLHPRDRFSTIDQWNFK